MDIKEIKEVFSESEVFFELVDCFYEITFPDSFTTSRIFLGKDEIEDAIPSFKEMSQVERILFFIDKGNKVEFAGKGGHDFTVYWNKTIRLSIKSVAYKIEGRHVVLNELACFRVEDFLEKLQKAERIKYTVNARYEPVD